MYKKTLFLCTVHYDNKLFYNLELLVNNWIYIFKGYDVRNEQLLPIQYINVSKKM